MKILILTLHHTRNCGSSLQAFALQYFLEKEGFASDIIDYRPGYLNESRLNVLGKRIIYFREYNKMITQNKIFRKTYLKKTSIKYKKYRDLAKNPPDADIYITGSDQLWNKSYPCGRDLAYYLKFPRMGNKIAYAVSLGRVVTSQSEIQWIYDNVKEFDFISVREVTSKLALEEKGINKVFYVCDPVLLLDKSVYFNMQIRPTSSKYVAVYLVNPCQLLEELITKIKEWYHLDVIVIGAFSHKCKCDKQVRGVSPCEFLGYIANADYIIAGSFHATIFSHIFEKDFAIIPPKENGARIEQFLELTGLQNRIIRSSDDMVYALDHIDYTEVNKKIELFVKDSRNLLIEQLHSYLPVQ